MRAVSIAETWSAILVLPISFIIHNEGCVICAATRGSGRLPQESILSNACATCRVVYEPNTDDDLLWLGCDSCNRCQKC